MLNNLYKLYLRNSTKTPLEDFTTEALAGILNYNNDFATKFTQHFLRLPKSEYQIKTQVKYELSDDVNCIIDLIFESEDIICFIENKVNSQEGYRQLERYTKVLNVYANNGYRTYLFYCTKFYDEKNLNVHNFRQFRWFQIAKLLKQDPDSLTLDYLQFLKSHKMSQDLTITTKDLFALENLVELLNILKGHIDRVQPLFEKTFISPIKISNGFTTNQLIKYGRVIYYFQAIIGSGGWSEIKYGFQTVNSMIYVGLWVDKSNSEYNSVKEYFLSNSDGFNVYNKENGIAIELNSSLIDYLNNENGDSEIASWFANSFTSFAQLINTLHNLDWKIKV